MSTLLRIDASPRLRGSTSRALADYFQERWLALNPSGRVIVRDLAKSPIPYIEEITIAGYFTPQAQHDMAMRVAVAVSDALVDEFLSANTLLIATPMYNFSVPAALKAYIDQIVRAGKTFRYDHQKGFIGLASQLSAVVISTKGQTYQQADYKLDFLDAYLQTVLGFMGITDVTLIPVEGTSERGLEDYKSDAMQKIDHLFS